MVELFQCRETGRSDHLAGISEGKRCTGDQQYGICRDLLTGNTDFCECQYYAKIVREKSVMRRLIKVNEETANTCYQGIEPLEEILERQRRRFLSLLQRQKPRVCSDQAGCSECIGYD